MAQKEIPDRIEWMFGPHDMFSVVDQLRDEDTRSIDSGYKYAVLFPDLVSTGGSFEHFTKVFVDGEEVEDVSDMDTTRYQISKVVEGEFGEIPSYREIHFSSDDVVEPEYERLD